MQDPGYKMHLLLGGTDWSPFLSWILSLGSCIFKQPANGPTGKRANGPTGKRANP